MEERAEARADGEKQEAEAELDAQHVRDGAPEAEVHARGHQHDVVGARRHGRDGGEGRQGKEDVERHGSGSGSETAQKLGARPPAGRR